MLELAMTGGGGSSIAMACDMTLDTLYNTTLNEDWSGAGDGGGGEVEEEKKEKLKYHNIMMTIKTMVDGCIVIRPITTM